jgi:hypothetical protein
MSNWRQPHDLANAQPSPTAATFWLFRARVCHQSWPVYLAGSSVKGDTGGRTRSAARRASTERVRMAGEAFTLDADGGHRAYRQGGGTKGEARHPFPRCQSGKNRRGMQPEGGCPSEARSVPIGDTIARSRTIRCHQKPRRSEVEVVCCNYLDILPPDALPQFLPMFCMTCWR